MPVYEYKGFDKKEKKTKGLITAENAAAARIKLTQIGVIPEEMRETKDESKLSSTSRLSILSKLRRVHPAEISTALRHLSTLISSGLPLIQCLSGIIDQTAAPTLKKVFSQIKEKVMEGSPLWSAMAGYPNLFGSVYVNMVRVGESGGALDVILERLAEFSEKRTKLKKKIEAALVYPAFLVMVSVVILVFLMSFVMPKIIGLFEGMRTVLPWSTRALISATHAARQFWWFIPLAIVLSWGAYSLLQRTTIGRRSFDRISLALPVAGSIRRKGAVARFTRTLAVLLRSGIPLVQSLDIARPSIGNLIMEDGVKETARLVGEGSDLAGPLKRTLEFPAIVVQLVNAGEQSGGLGDMLAKAADVYENEVESAVATLTALLEPVVILVMGVIVGYIVLSVLLPILDLTGSIK